ncbi:MAG: DUF3810 domain-containing protein [Bacteroidia bacterium]|nr:DUF3810 domain-containing protein [Bacteroidia bacterium]
MKQTSQTAFFSLPDRRLVWIAAGLVTWGLRQILAANPYFTEVVFSRGVFLLFRLAFDYTLGWLPFPWLYIAVPVLVWAIIRGLRRMIRHIQPLTPGHRAGYVLIGMVSAGAAAYTLFMWLWGFNYHRRPIADQLGLQADTLSQAAFEAAFSRATREALAARDAAVATRPTWDLHYPWHELEHQVRHTLTSALRTTGYPVAGRVRGLPVWPRGLLMGLGATGIYIPYVGEGHLDAALHPLTTPYTLAHEMAHGYGFGDEGTCNFWAYLACIQAEDPMIRYSGYLMYWRIMAASYRAQQPDAYQAIRDTLPQGFIADMQAINEVYRQYPGFFPKTSEAIYNQYLRQQGIREGIANYNKVILLAEAWRAQASGQPGE